MSELAEQDRRVKRGWAKPGSSHDKLVRILKFGLPVLAGLLLAFLALVPLEERKEVSFLVDKAKIEQAGERLKVEAAQYRGQDEEGRPFVLDARSAIQASSADPVLEIADMRARLQMADGPAEITAGRARFNPDENKVDVIGDVLITGANGYRLLTSDVLVDLRDRSLQSRGAVQGQIPQGNFSADQLKGDLSERTVVLEGNARLRIEQGALKGR